MNEEIVCSECQKPVIAMPKIEHGSAVFYGAMKITKEMLEDNSFETQNAVLSALVRSAEPWKCPHCAASFEHQITVEKLNSAREVLGLPVFFLRLNEDATLTAPVHHVERIGLTEVRITDTALFDPGRWPAGGVRLVLFELFDKDMTLWAMRRIPEHLAPLLTNSYQLQVNFCLKIVQEDFVGVENVG
jgi:hypothetical protein